MTPKPTLKTKIGIIVTALAFVATVVPVAYPAYKHSPYFCWLIVAGLIVFVVVVLRGEIGAVVEKAAPSPERKLLCLLCLCLFCVIVQLWFGPASLSVILSTVADRNPPFSVVLEKDGISGGLFNAWSGTDNPGFAHVCTSGESGTTWLRLDDELAVGFEFHKHAAAKRVPVAPGVATPSSGGFLDFYNHRHNREEYRYLNFACKLSRREGKEERKPDFGVRLVLDDLGIHAADKEIVAYETRSVVSLGNPLPKEIWQRYHIYLWQLERAPTKNSIPRDFRLSQNDFNKLVFFVDNNTVELSSQGTLWFREISLTSEAR